MNLLIVDPKKSLRDLLVKRLLPLGITIYHAESPEQANVMLGSVKAQALLLDLDGDPQAGLVFLTMLSKLPLKPVRIVVSSIADRAMITQIVSTGVAGYIVKPFTEESGLEKLVGLLRAIGGGDEKRSFFRVTPNPLEDRKVFFRLPQSARLVSGTMLNISAGGMAVNCNEDLSEEDLQQGMFMQKIQLKLDNNDVFLSGDVVYRKGTAFAIRLRDCTERDMHTLARYIFSRISETV